MSQSLRQPRDMENGETLRVVHADIMNGCAVIGFSNGVTALYSALLLYSILHQADQVESKDPEED